MKRNRFLRSKLVKIAFAVCVTATLTSCMEMLEVLDLVFGSSDTPQSRPAYVTNNNSSAYNAGSQTAYSNSSYSSTGSSSSTSSRTSTSSSSTSSRTSTKTKTCPKAKKPMSGGGCSGGVFQCRSCGYQSGMFSGNQGNEHSCDNCGVRHTYHDPKSSASGAGGGHFCKCNSSVHK